LQQRLLVYIQEFSEAFGGGVPVEGFAGSAVELGGDGGEVFGGVD
jgi:hypothetical protein